MRVRSDCAFVCPVPGEARQACRGHELTCRASWTGRYVQYLALGARFEVGRGGQGQVWCVECKSFTCTQMLEVPSHVSRA